MQRPIMLLSLVSALLMLLSGCASLTASDRGKPAVDIQTLSSATGSIARVRLAAEEGGLRITGVFRRLHPIRLPGHIEVNLYGEQGLLAQKSVRPAGLASQRRGLMERPFGMRLEVDPASVRQVTLAYQAPAGASGSICCGH